MGIDVALPGPVELRRDGLHSYISRLRRRIGADAIVHEPGGYRLRADGARHLPAAPRRCRREGPAALPAARRRPFRRTPVSPR
ncbi:hypothetical protein [Actinoplanes sp. RD1]|uniref:hypothetical protein n=1 Tax=Actinoplanes sp. RD1 TaxID=3064538 RepID=UPI0027423DB2|nr:hypothetical protein [Actinoplanes sp. RD1]